jgi:hypothetical protein
MFCNFLLSHIKQREFELKKSFPINFQALEMEEKWYYRKRREKSTEWKWKAHK